jgi:long-chain acyl-CoA synthetase
MVYHSLAEMLLAQTRKYGDRVLYRFFKDGDWSSYSWLEALNQIRSTGLGLLSLGVRKGERVAILSPNRVEWSLVDWANICIGALTVPLYASSTSGELEHILGDAGASVLILESMERLAKVNLNQPSLRSVRMIVVMDAGEPSPSFNTSSVRVLSLAELQELGRRKDESDPALFDRLARSLRPEDDLTIIYTSGTTGEPKGVLTTHGHYLFMIDSTQSAISSTDRDVNLQFLPFAHSFGRLEHFMVVARGYTCGFARSMETIGKDLMFIRPSLLFSVPRLYENAYSRIQSRVSLAGPVRKAIFQWAVAVGEEVSLHQRARKPVPLHVRLKHLLAYRLVFKKIHSSFGGRLRLAISGGAPLALEIGTFFHALGVLILEGYGLTEAATASHVNRLDYYKFGTVGLPLTGVECSIASDGEILLKGPNIFKGYYNDAGATREVVDEQGWLHTGDIGMVDEDGFLSITDRKKDFIVTSGGKKVAPQAIESLLKADALFNQVMVVGDGRAHLLALVTLRRDQVVEWGKREGLSFDGTEDVAGHPSIQALVKEKIRKVNKELAPFEAIRGFRILSRDFTIENGELTPTLKLKRQVILQHYRELIEEMG